MNGFGIALDVGMGWWDSVLLMMTHLQKSTHVALPVLLWAKTWVCLASIAS